MCFIVGHNLNVCEGIGGLFIVFSCVGRSVEYRRMSGSARWSPSGCRVAYFVGFGC